MLKRILMLTILFTIIISFSLIGASAADLPLTGNMTEAAIDALSATIGGDATVNVQLTGDAVLAKAITIPSTVTNINVVYNPLGSAFSLTPHSTGLFNFDSATGLIEIRTDIGDENNKNVNYPSDFRNLNYFNSGTSTVDGKIYIQEDQSVVYTSLAGVGLTYFGDPTDQVNKPARTAADKIISDGAILYVVLGEVDGATPDAVGSIVDLGTLGIGESSFVVDATNKSSSESAVYFNFGITAQAPTSTDPENTITLPSNGYFNKAGAVPNGAYVLVNYNKIYYAGADTAMDEITSTSTIIYLDGTGHELNDVEKNVILYGNDTTEDENKITTLTFKDASDFSSTKVTLQGSAYSDQTPYIKSSGTNYHYKESSIARLVSSGATIYIDHNNATCDLGTTDRNIILASAGTPARTNDISFATLSGSNFYVKILGTTFEKSEPAYYLDYSSATTPYKIYYSNVATAAANAISTGKTLNIKGSKYLTYELGSISGTLTVNGDCTTAGGKIMVTYTSISGTLSLEGDAVSSGGVYLSKGNKDVYYTNVANAISKLNSSSYKTYSDDKILYLTGAPNKVHNLGDISNTLQVFGTEVNGDKAVISYDTLTGTLVLIGNDAVNSNGGSYLYTQNAVTVNGVDYDTRSYHGTLKAAYDYAKPISDGGKTGSKTIYLDESDTVYDLSSAGYDWDDWKINGNEDVTVSLSGINYTTLTLNGGVRSSHGFYTGTSTARTYYKLMSTAISNAGAGYLYLDESETTYNLGAIISNLSVKGDGATVTYDSIATTGPPYITLTLDKDANMASGRNDAYVLETDKDKRYYTDFDKTLIDVNTAGGEVICGTGTINVGVVSSAITIKGVGDNPVYVKYDEITGVNTLTLQGTAQHYNNEGGVFALESNGDRVYYRDAITAIPIVTTNATIDDVLYFEKMATSDAYQLGDVDQEITCRADTTETGTIKLEYTMVAGGALTILKSDVDKDKIECVDQGNTDQNVRVDGNADVEVMIEHTESGSESYIYYPNINEAVDNYGEKNYDTIKLTQDAQCDNLTPIAIDESMLIIGLGVHNSFTVNDTDDDYDHPSIVSALVNITSDNVSLENLEFTGTLDMSNMENIIIDECKFDGGATSVTATGVENCKISECVFDDYTTTGIQATFDIENNFDIANNSFLEDHAVLPGITLVGNVAMTNDDDDDEEKQYVSVLQFGNFRDTKKTINDINVDYFDKGNVDIGNYFLKYLKVADDDIYEYGKSDFYKIVDTSVSSVLIEAEVDESSSNIDGKNERYSKNISLSVDNFTEVSFTVTDANDVSNDYTVHIYRKAQASNDISRTVFDDDELQDVIRLISSTGTADSNLSKGIIYEAVSKTELEVTEADIDELKSKDIDLTLNLNNGYMSIDVSKLDSLWPGDSYYKFVASVPSGTVKNPNDDDVALKRVEFKVLSMPSGREIDINYSIISGISTDGIDFDKYDSSTLKVYYYNSTTGAYTIVSASEYFTAENMMEFTAPHYSQYVLTGQEAEEGSYNRSMSATVIDINDDPLSGYKITIDGSTRTTNSAGEVSFSPMNSSSGSIQILDSGNNSVFSGTYSIKEGTSNTWSASNDNLVITHTSDVTTLDVLFEYVSASNINVTDVDFYSNPKTGFPFFTSTAGYITIFLILAALVGAGFFVTKKFILKKA